MNKPLIAVIAVLAGAFWVAPASGQDAPETAPEQIATELAGIQRSLDALVDLLATMRRNQDAELVLRRIELHERRLAPLASRLESNKQDQINTTTNITDANEWKSRTEDEIDNLERDGRDEATPELRQQVIIAVAEIERLTRRLEGLQQRQIELEDRLADGRDEVEILDDLLQELLR